MSVFWFSLACINLICSGLNFRAALEEYAWRGNWQRRLFMAVLGLALGVASIGRVQR